MEAAARKRWIGLVFISIAVSLIIVDSTIVNVAVPSIVDELGITSTEVQWVQEAYTLVFAALLLLFGSLADRFGRRRVMLLGVVLFAASSVFAALAPDGGILILSRLVQGVGGAMILPTTLSLINATFRGKERGIAFAVWGSTIGGMAAVGPLLGGWLTTAFSWRWAFGINVPLGIIIIIGVLLTVAESKEPRRGRLDIVGSVLSVLLFGSLVFGLIEGRTYGWWTLEQDFTIGSFTWPFELSPIPVAFAIAVVALVGFIWWGLARAKQGKGTLLEFSLFRIPSFRNGNVAALVVSLGEFGIILSLPLWLQFVLGFDALQTGFLLLALALGSFFASGAAGAFSGKVARRHRPSRHRRGDHRRRVGRVHHRAGRGLGMARPRPVRLRLRGRARHGATHRRHPPGRARAAVGSGIGHAVHVASGRLGARRGDPRHGPLHDDRRGAQRIPR
ncbi:hypothetical protein MSA03_19760 [Microbacterium saccharophilum]|nr:hypothetical protein MSA03_19760 [Microbacterium saccharophilum]